MIGTVVLFAHAAYSFYVFGFPVPALELPRGQRVPAYAVLLVYLLSQSAVGTETAMHDVLTYIAFALIAGHVCPGLAARPRSGRPAKSPACARTPGPCCRPTPSR